MMLIDNSSFASGQKLSYPNGGRKVVRFRRQYGVVDGRFLEDTFRIALTLILTAKTNTAVFTPIDRDIWKAFVQRLYYHIALYRK